MGGAGFGNTPQSFALRVTIVGHSSVRWRSARSGQQAMSRNHDLSTRRADAVRELVEKELRKKLGPSFPIEYAVSSVDSRVKSGVTIGAHGEGSIQALRQGKGRNDDSQSDRRVEVKIEKITTTYTTGGVSLPPLRIAGETKSWALGVTRMRALAIGYAHVDVELVLRNRLTDKRMYATASLDGGGLGSGAAKAGKDLMKQIADRGVKNLTQAYEDFVGRGEVFFETDQKMTFESFDGEIIRMGKALASIGIKGVLSYIEFTGFHHWPEPIVFQKKITVGWPNLEGWVVAGVLRLRGPNPGDWFDYDQEDVVYDSYDRVWDESLLLSFPTGKSQLAPAEAEKATLFARTWANRI